MNSQSLKEKKLRHVRGLIAKATDSATSPEEAESFMAKAQELIDKYDLSSEDIHVANSEIATGFFNSYVDVKNEANSYINREWLRYIAGIIAKANLCKTVVYYTKKKLDKVPEPQPMYQIQFIGREDKLLFAMELFEFYWKKMLKLCKEAYKLSKYKQMNLGGLRLKLVTDYQWVDPAVFYRSYLEGVEDGLREMYKRIEIENHNKNPEYALIITNHENAINVYIEENIGKLSSLTYIREREKNASAYNQGKEDVKQKTRKRLRD